MVNSQLLPALSDSPKIYKLYMDPEVGVHISRSIFGIEKGNFLGKSILERINSKFSRLLWPPSDEILQIDRIPKEFWQLTLIELNRFLFPAKSMSKSFHVLLLPSKFGTVADPANTSRKSWNVGRNKTQW